MDLVRRVSGELLRSLSAESASLAEPAELSAPTRIDVDVYEADVEEPEWGWYDEQDPHLEPGAGPHGGGGAAHAAGPHGGAAGGPPRWAGCAEFNTSECNCRS